MNPTFHTYLVDTRKLTPAERSKTEELINAVCAPWGMLPPNMFTVAHTYCSPDEFTSMPFPDGCIIHDVTGQNMMPQR